MLATWKLYSYLWAHFNNYDIIHWVFKLKTFKIKNGWQNFYRIHTKLTDTNLKELILSLVKLRMTTVLVNIISYIGNNFKLVNTILHNILKSFEMQEMKKKFLFCGKTWINDTFVSNLYRNSHRY